LVDSEIDYKIFRASPYFLSLDYRFSKPSLP
jgi:hypothetical protein